MSIDRIIIGTRGSKLALWQTNHVAEALRRRYPALRVEIKEIVTRGDLTQAQGTPLPKIGGKGLFTAELEDAMRRGEADLAVHSLKDLPTAADAVFEIAAVLPRAGVRDALFSGGAVKLMQLPAGAVVGTSSLRRSSQLRRIRPDLVYRSIRGNVDTRIAKTAGANAEYAATILAEAGVDRLGRLHEASEILDIEVMLPAPAQGAMAVQCMSANSELRALVAALECSNTRAETDAERGFLAELQAGCSTPVAALARVTGEELSFRGRCLSHDGKECIEVSGSGRRDGAAALGRSMAQEAKRRGFDRLELREPGCDQS